MSNGTNKNNENTNRRRSPIVWFKSLGRTSQIALILALSLSVVAFAETVLWNSIHKTINPGKARYIEVEIDGVADTFSDIKPGDSVSVAPAIRNEGSVAATAFMKVAVPKASDGAAAYDYSKNDNWTVVQSDDSGDNIEIVYAFVSDGMLATVYPGNATDELCKGFTLKSGITGAEFYAMDSIAIEVDGYLVDADEGDDPDAVWTKLGQ